MSDPQRRLERIAAEHGLIPRYLREIVYYSAIGYHQKHICDKTDYSPDAVSRYRRKLREMSEEEAAEVFELVAQLRKPEVEA